MSRALLALQAATLFEISPTRHLLRARGPDGSLAPRFYAAGCAEGWVGYVRDDVDAAAARVIHDLVAREPAVTVPGGTPRFAQDYCDILGGEPLTPHNYGPVHRLRAGTAFSSDAIIVGEGTPEGDALIERIRRDGMPRHLIDAGFVDLTHFWSPWCVALAGGEIAAMAFCVRDGLLAREIGVYTFDGFRGRGYAAAVTAAWSALHPRHPVLFYSTHRDNLSSQRVIARLRLPFLGESMRLP